MAGTEDRTEAPTPRRKREARQEGRIARSADAPVWTAVLVASFLVPSLLGRVGRSAGDSLRAVRDLPAAPEPADAFDRLGTSLQHALLATVPLLLAVTFTLIAANVAQVGFVLSAKPLKPRLDRLNPVRGLKQLLSAHALWDTAKSVLRVSMLALVAVPAVTGATGAVLGTGTASLGPSLSLLAARSLRLVRVVALAGLAISVADYAVARRRIGRQVRMTKQEVREEHRNTEGDPHVKAKLRSMRRMFSQNRMIAGAADADVVIVNPTHFAVAVKYDRTVGVPVVVARGTDKLALRLREIAAGASIPIVEEKPLARALYWTCEVGEAIPRELYEGVARVLAFVYSLAPGTTGVTYSLPPTLRTDLPDDVTGPGARSRAAQQRRERAHGTGGALG